MTETGSTNGFYPGDLGEPDDDEEELELFEEILDDWEYLGWFDLLPTGLMTITASFDDVTAPRLDFDAIAPDDLAERGLTVLNGDPLWAVMSEDMPEEDRLENHDEAYRDYLSGVEEQREQWAELVARQPEYAVGSLNGLVDLLIGWGLLRAVGDDLELVEPVPDPLELLSLSEQTIAAIILDRMGPEMEAVEDVLHEFLYHGDADELSTTLQKLADQADVTLDVVRLTVAMLISQADSGISADRFGPLQADDVDVLKEHQKFTLRVDRSAPGFGEHEH